VRRLQKNKLQRSQIKTAQEQKREEVRIEKILQMVPEAHSAQRREEIIILCDTSHIVRQKPS